MAHLGTFVRQVRVARLLDRPALAARLGFDDKADALRLLVALEETGHADPDYRARVRAGLRITRNDWDEVVDMARLLARLPRRRHHIAHSAELNSPVFVVNEFAKFFAARNRTHDASQALIVRLVTHTGVTAEELCGIKGSDFDFAKGRIRIPSVDGGGVIFGRVFAAALECHRNTWPGPWLFAAKDGRPMSAGRVKRIVGQYSEK